MIVEVVGFRRGKSSGRVTDRMLIARGRTGILEIVVVRVEIDCAVLGRILIDIRCKSFIIAGAIQDVCAHIIFQADRINNVDRICIRNFQDGFASGGRNIIVAQRQHAGRNLNLHTVTSLRTIAASDFDDNIA